MRVPPTFFAALAIAAVMGLAACSETSSPPPPGFTFDRGAQLLSAGSPKSAIPFLTQTVAATPDGPEPVALLSLAYALDLQDERAIVEIQQVHRPESAPPGWEVVALGIAQMTEHHPAQAVKTLDRMTDDALPESPVKSSARQWKALALILAGEDVKAIQLLRSDYKSSPLDSSSFLWVSLIDAQHERKSAARDALVQCAKMSVTSSGQLALGSSLDGADDQTLYDAAIAAVADGDLQKAQGLFSRVTLTNQGGGDTPVWLALIANVNESWLMARNQLSAACETGPNESRGLASQLFSVVCALEDRPDAMIEYTLAGQRLLQRRLIPTTIHEQPKPESVWFSDSMK